MRVLLIRINQTGKGKQEPIHLFLVGIDDYPDHPLYNCVRDLTVLREVLLERYCFEPQSIKVCLNKEATRANILQILRQYVAVVEEHDNFIFYFSGHGMVDPLDGEGYWLPSDCSLGDFAINGIGNKDVLKLIKALKARHILLLVDSCFSGAVFNQKLMIPAIPADRLGAHKSRWAFTSGRTEPVLDGKPGHHSPFAEMLIKYLQNNQEDRLFSSTLFNDVKVAVSNNAAQEPDARILQNTGDEGGQFIFYLKTLPAPVVPANIPVDTAAQIPATEPANPALLVAAEWRALKASAIAEEFARSNEMV